MYLSEHSEEVFFEQVQSQQVSFLRNLQSEFLREHVTTTQDDILRMNEASHVNLAHVFANVLWDGFLLPLVQGTQSISIARCTPTPSGNGSDAITEEQLVAQRVCFAEVGASIMALPRFVELDAKVRATMRTSSVFKIKVFDLRGLTVYSSEPAQIGELKSDNLGWKSAARGLAASELTHRKRFSAFEGVVENRDLISSYIPVFDANKKVLAVFEIYSDATPFLEEMHKSSTALARRIADNEAAVEAVASNNFDRLYSNNRYSQFIGGGLLALFYVLLLLIVHNGQRILNRQSIEQAEERARANERERLWHREKMAALATMAANVAHETGNPLATISGIAEVMESERSKLGCAICEPKIILEQTQRIVTMTRKIVDFSAVRSAEFEPVDINQMVTSVCEFLSFDNRFHGIQFEFSLGSALSACDVIPDYFTEAFMYLMQRYMEEGIATRSAGHRIVIRTHEIDGEVCISISAGAKSMQSIYDCERPAFESRYEFAHSRIKDIGGELLATKDGVELRLKVSQQNTTSA